jgi:hypothetical protein
VSASEADRGQTVLLAAGLVAVALAAMLLAYAPVSDGGDAPDAPSVTASDVRHALDRVAWNASHAVTERDDAVAVRERFRATFASDVDALRAEWAASGVAVGVAPNVTAAATWADEACPRGPNRNFDACVADGGLVTQERATGRFVVAVAVDVSLRPTATDRETRLVLLLRPGA